MNIAGIKIYPWRQKADWEMPPRLHQTLHSPPPPGLPTLHLWGLYIARVSSQKIIAQQVVGNNVYELIKGGSSCEV